jgi:hypothetical protein
MTWVTVAIALMLVATGGGLYLGLARRRAVPAEPPYNYFRCPGCKRRLRYLASRAGHRGACPTCHRDLTFPAGAVRPASGFALGVRGR